MTERRITMTDCKRAGYCGPAVFRWFKRNNLDIRAFVRDGIDIETVRSVGDAYALKIVEKVESDGR